MISIDSNKSINNDHNHNKSVEEYIEEKFEVIKDTSINSDEQVIENNSNNNNIALSSSTKTRMVLNCKGSYVVGKTPTGTYKVTHQQTSDDFEKTVKLFDLNSVYDFKNYQYISDSMKSTLVDTNSNNNIKNNTTDNNDNMDDNKTNNSDMTDNN